MPFYIGAFLLIISLVAMGSQTQQQTSTFANAQEGAVQTKDNSSQREVSVDDMVATNVAASIAQTTDLPVAANVSNLSQSVAAESVLSETDKNIVSKPQIVKPTASSREVKQYVTKTGDTIPEIAKRFNISPQTIKWANGLSSDAVEPDKTLKILPVDGVIYTAKSTDTIDSIVNKYSANKEQFIAFNDLELGGLVENKQLIIPSGQLPETEQPGYVAPRGTTRASSNTSFSGGYGSAYRGSVSVGNRYAGGNCTWYAYERRMQLGRPVGSFWGNAGTWASYAASSGYSVNGTPAPGAVMADRSGYYGHVAIVESVNPGVSISISEMNGYRFGGGFNRVGHGDIPWDVATSGAYKYIH